MYELCKTNYVNPELRSILTLFLLKQFTIDCISRKICLDNDFQLHLQLLMLTHDDLVFNSVVNGYNKITTDNEKAENLPDMFPFLQGRLFKLEELDILFKKEIEGGQNLINVYLKDYE